MLDEYERTVRALYDRSESLLPALAFAGDSLNQGGHIYYLGEGTAGKLGIVDASECPPTFGAGYSDVRGFIENGWRSFCPACTDLSDSGPLFNIDMNYFERDILPELTENDTLILTGTEGFFGRYSSLPELCKRTNVYKILICRTYPAHPKHSIFDLIIGEAKDRKKMPFFTSTSLKLIYNAITTAAYIFKGKVFKNKMIDMRISNTKLYQRSIHIIGELMGVEEEIAKRALLRSVYQTDHLKTAVLNDPLSRHVARAAKREKIVPVALVLATGKFTYREAFACVQKEHIIRNIIRQSGKLQEVR